MPGVFRCTKGSSKKEPKITGGTVSYRSSTRLQWTSSSVWPADGSAKDRCPCNADDARAEKGPHGIKSPQKSTDERSGRDRQVADKIVKADGPGPRLRWGKINKSAAWPSIKRRAF